MTRTRLFGRLAALASKAMWGYEQGITNPEALEAAWQREGIRRRDLLRISLGAAGLAALPACMDEPPDSSMEEPRPAMPGVAIIGAGLAGLHCAYRLAQAGIRARVYEASSRIGGRTLSLRNHGSGGLIAELGAELIDSNHAVMWQLSQELDIELDDCWAGEPPGFVRDIWYVGGAAVDSSVVAEQLAQVAPAITEMGAMAEIDEQARTALDHTSLADWLHTHVPKGQYPELHAVLEAAYVCEFGLDAAEQSALNMLNLIDYQVPSPFRIYGDSDERYRVRGGSQRFAEALAEALEPDQLALDIRLVGLHSDDRDGYRLVLEQADGSRLEAQAEHVVLAVPFSVLRHIEITVPLSAPKREVIDNLGYGTHSKVIGTFDTRPWVATYNAGGNVVSDLPMQQIWDSSPDLDSVRGVLTNFVGGTQGVSAGDGAAEDWYTGVVLDGLAQVLPGAEAAYVPGSAVRKQWASAPYAQGSYSCYRPGQWSYRGIEGAREGNIHFCGEHCSLDFQGWMEGAAETGGVAAAEVLADLGIEPAPRHRPLLRWLLRGPHPCMQSARPSRHAQAAGSVAAPAAAGSVHPGPHGRELKTR